MRRKIPIPKKDNEGLYIFDEVAHKRAESMYKKEDPFPKEMYNVLKNTVEKAWLTRMYFSRGIHNLVLPAWVLGKISPEGEGRHSIAGLPMLVNTDLRSYFALGSPDSEEEPVIDHKGGIIPIPGSYTLIFGTVYQDQPKYMSEIGEVTVDLHEDGYPITTVTWSIDNDKMIYHVYADREDDIEALAIHVVRGFANHKLLFTLCPFDQDGLTEVEEISYDKKEYLVTINNLPNVIISEAPIRTLTSSLEEGHAGRLVISPQESSEQVVCMAKAASFAAEFPVRASPTFTIPLSEDEELPEYFPDMDDIEDKWEDYIDELPTIDIKAKEITYFFNSSAIVLRLLTDINRSVVTVGPSVQEQLWVPALVHQTIALDRIGLSMECVRPILDNICSQVDNNGVVGGVNQQWDAQGALVMAVANHFFITLDYDWLGEKFSVIKRIGDWVIRTRKKQEDSAEPLITGLLTEGNPSWINPLYWKNDYYYSHNLWGLSVLKNLYLLATEVGKHGEATTFKQEYEKYLEDLSNSLSIINEELSFVPAGPFLADSSEMVFNLFAYYPLHIYTAGFLPLNHTFEHLWKNYVNDGGLFIDQPWNAFATHLSVLVAQAARELGYSEKVLQVIRFLRNNYNNRQGWAEGVSPLTNKGAVGDSPNGLTAATWINLIGDLLVENRMDAPPILLKGIPLKWLEKGVNCEKMTLYRNANISFNAQIEDSRFEFEWSGENLQEDALPILYLDLPITKIPKELEQISTYEYQLKAAEGEIKIKLRKD